jgi:hypothetical protein
MNQQEKDKLTPLQIELLGILATTYFNSKADNCTPEYYRGKLQGIEWACAIAKIDDGLVYDIVINGNISGLRNYNRISEVTYFEPSQDYANKCRRMKTGRVIGKYSR